MGFNTLCRLNVFQTIRINLKLFPLKMALKLPIFIGKHTYVRLPKGSVQIDGAISSGMIRVGLTGSPDLLKYESNKNVFIVKNGGKVIFKGQAHFAAHVSILASGATLEFGNYFRCNVGCRFSAVSGITFGNDCLLGGSCVVRDSDGHHLYDCDASNQIVAERANKAPVTIGDHVWIGNNVSILKGVSIESNNMISYGSLVTKPIPGSYQIIGGVPAKVIKTNTIWKS